MKKPALLCALLISGVSFASAQITTWDLNTVYQCPGDTAFRALSCAGSAPTDMCSVETVALGRLRYPGQSTRADITKLLSLCHVQTPVEAQTSTANGALGKDFNGFSVREQVQVSTTQGWKGGLIVAMNGNDYRVLLPDGSEIVKLYPSELRRIGPFTERDRALGLFNLQERVQVLMEGKVEVGEIVAAKGMDYEVRLSPNRTLWANGRVLMLAPASTAGASAAAPPQPNLKSCAGSIEGGYQPTGSEGLVIEFRSGMALVRALNGNEQTLECWRSGEKVYLLRPGESAGGMTIDVNSDGSLKTPLGEIAKPPKPGLTSCAGEIEGRYQPTSGVGPVIEFRSGKALVRAQNGDDENALQCWMGGEKIYLHRPGELVNNDMTIDVNSDGSLKTPLGEISKK